MRTVPQYSSGRAKEKTSKLDLARHPVTVLPPVNGRRLRGREVELELIREALASTSDGRGGILIVEGAAGLGKTSLLREAAAMAETVGVKAGYGGLTAGDQTVPMAALFDALFDGAKPLVNHNEIRRLHLIPSERHWLLEDLEDLLEKTAITAPMLLCIDDLQWGTSASFSIARALPPRVRTLPIMWMYASRPSDVSDELRSALVHLEEAGARRIALGPLQSDAVVEIVGDVIGAKPDASLVELAERAHGSPFLLVEMLNGLLEEGLIQVDGGQASLIEDRLPMRVRDTMRDRLSRMTPLARSAAEVASVLGRRFTFASLVTMLDVPPVKLLAPLEELMRADLLIEDGEHLGFKHDLLRESVRQTLPATVRRTLQRHAVDLLLDVGSTPVDVALQLAESAEVGDHAAAETLYKAAKAIGASAPEMAADLARRALDLIEPNDPLRAPLVVEVAILLHAAGRVVEGKQFAETALHTVLPSEEDAAVQFSISGMLSLSADVRAEANRRALALPDLSDATRAKHLARLFFNVLGAGRREQAMEILPEAEAAAEQTADPDALFSVSLGKSGLFYIDGDFSRDMEPCETAILIGRQTRDVSRQWLAQQFRSESLVVLDRLDEARAVADEGRAACERARQAVSRRHWDAWRGRQLFYAGNLADAAAVLEGAYASEEAVNIVSNLDAAAVVALGQVAIHTNDEALTRTAVAIARRLLSTGVPEVQRLASWLLALNAQAASRITEACAAISTTSSPLPTFPVDVGDPPKLVRLGLAASRPDIADHAAALADARAAKNPAIATITGVAAHARGLRDGSVDTLRQAVELLSGSPRPLIRTSALEDLGGALIAKQSVDEGIERLSSALEEYVRIGATWDAQRVRARLGGLGIRRRVILSARPETGWEALTESERKVVELVAQGLTNREAAQQLFVSPHTVSMHLRHAFRKLGIKSRVELTQIALTEASAPVERR